MVPPPDRQLGFRVDQFWEIQPASSTPPCPLLKRCEASLPKDGLDASRDHDSDLVIQASARYERERLIPTLTRSEFGDDRAHYFIRNAARMPLAKKLPQERVDLDLIARRACEDAGPQADTN
jgi:hypothetical protein